MKTNNNKYINAHGVVKNPVENGFLIYVEDANDPFVRNKIKSELDFERTSIACPEQYDVRYIQHIMASHIKLNSGKITRENKVVSTTKMPAGYIRLRSGELTCNYPDVNGPQIYYYKFDDPMKGSFQHDTERAYFLDQIAEAIIDQFLVFNKPIMVENTKDQLEKFVSLTDQ